MPTNAVAHKLIIGVALLVARLMLLCIVITALARPTDVRLNVSPRWRPLFPNHRQRSPRQAGSL